MKPFIAEKHKKIGQNVARVRKEKGLSQLELSLCLGHKSIDCGKCGAILSWSALFCNAFARNSGGFRG